MGEIRRYCGLSAWPIKLSTLFPSSLSVRTHKHIASSSSLNSSPRTNKQQATADHLAVAVCASALAERTSSLSTIWSSSSYRSLLTQTMELITSVFGIDRDAWSLSDSGIMLILSICSRPINTMPQLCLYLLQPLFLAFCYQIKMPFQDSWTKPSIHPRDPCASCLLPSPPP